MSLLRSLFSRRSSTVEEKTTEESVFIKPRSSSNCSEMSAWFKKKQSKEGVQRMETQMHIAKHSPDSVIDLSACDLVHVPEGIYSLCRVLLKQGLLLNSNRLKSLKDHGSYSEFAKLKEVLRVLDVHENELEELPDDIGHLKHLQVLNLANNRLKSLPKQIGGLPSLQTLNLEGNPVHQLPSEIGRLQSLRSLNISKTQITELPLDMAKLRALDTLILEPGEMHFPPSDVCSQGTEAVMKFLCNACGLQYQPPSAQVLSLLNVPTPTGRLSPKNMSLSYNHLDDLSKQAREYERLKKQRMSDQAKMQKEMLEAREQTANLVHNNERDKGKLLAEIAKEQDMMDCKIMNLQQKKELEKQRLIATISEMETHADNLFREILEMNKQVRWTEQQLEEEENRKLMEEEFFKTKFDEYERFKKEEVQRAMEAMMAQNFSLEQLRDRCERDRADVVFHALEESTNHDENVGNVLRVKDAMAKELMNRLKEDEEFQKEAILTLMEQRDARSNRLNQQIYLIQNELAQLSRLELQNKEHRTAFNQEILEQERMNLTKLLIQLLTEKDKRTVELQKRLIEMEKARQDCEINYWLIQYQRLLETKPAALINQEQSLDTDILKILNKAGAQDYIPAFAKHQITLDSLADLTEEDLQKIGIYQTEVRRAVLTEISNYFASIPPRGEKSKKLSTPSAAEEARAESSSTTTIVARLELECVVCMERNSALIFVPCGHMCCCGTCGPNVKICPMCRSEIQQKVDMSVGHRNTME